MFRWIWRRWRLRQLKAQGHPFPNIVVFAEEHELDKRGVTWPWELWPPTEVREMTRSSRRPGDEHP